MGRDAKSRNAVDEFSVLTYLLMSALAFFFVTFRQ